MWGKAICVIFVLDMRKDATHNPQLPILVARVVLNLEEAQ